MDWTLPGLGWSAEKQSLDLLGYAAPLPLAEPERASDVLSAYQESTLGTKNPHITSHLVRRLLADPGLTRAVETLCGKSLTLWRSAVFSKTTGSAEIGWHHDKHFHEDGIEDIRLDDLGVHYSVLFGLTSIEQKTGMMEFIPGSHRSNAALERDLLARYLNLKKSHIIDDLPDNILNNRRAVPIPAGSFVIFHSAILHRSLPHGGGQDRLGLAIRLMRSEIKAPDSMVKPNDLMSYPPAA